LSQCKKHYSPQLHSALCILDVDAVSSLCLLLRCSVLTKVTVLVRKILLMRLEGKLEAKDVLPNINRTQPPKGLKNAVFVTDNLDLCVH